MICRTGMLSGEHFGKKILKIITLYNNKSSLEMVDSGLRVME